MAEKTKRPVTMWVIIAIVAIVILMFAGLLPLPGQKDNVTPHTQPSAPGTQPQATLPSGPPTSPPSEPGAGTPPPPGGTPSPSPGGPTTSASDQTMTGDSPKRDPK